MESVVPLLSAAPKMAMHTHEASASRAETPNSTRCGTLSPSLENTASEQTATSTHCTTPRRLCPTESRLPAAAYRYGMNWPLVPAARFHVRYTATRNTMVLTLTGFFSALAIMRPNDSCPAASPCFSAQSLDSCS